MIKNIPYFNLLSFETVSNLHSISAGEKLNLSLNANNNEHLYYCITPKEFDYYNLWICENIHFKDYGYYSIEDEYDEQYVSNKVLSPIMKLKEQFVFFKATPKHTGYYIEEIYNTKEVFQYWIKHNHFTELEKWKHIGISKSIFNLLPSNHNYYDRNLICTCGQSTCNNQEVWYIKYTDSFSIPFVIDLNKRIVFDLHYFDKENEWQDEDYIEANYEEKENYKHFPFLFEAKNFRLLQQSLFANE